MTFVQGLFLDTNGDQLVGRAENGFLWLWDLTSTLGWERPFRGQAVRGSWLEQDCSRCATHAVRRTVQNARVLRCFIAFHCCSLMRSVWLSRTRSGHLDNMRRGHTDSQTGPRRLAPCLVKACSLTTGSAPCDGEPLQDALTDHFVCAQIICPLHTCVATARSWRSRASRMTQRVKVLLMAITIICETEWLLPGFNGPLYES